MDVSKSIEQLIREHVIFSRKAATGFEQLKCGLCNDYKIRAGFNFSESGKIRYHCFNCSTDTSYYENSANMSDKFHDVLTSFHIDAEIIDKTLFEKRGKEDSIKFVPKEQKSETSLPNQVELPKDSYPLGDDEWSIVAKEFIESRSLSVNNYSWFLSSDRKYRTKLIIPYFRQGKIIYWQAREMDDSSKDPRYLNPPIARDNILFNFDELSRYSREPLFITEGVFDALSIGKNYCIGLAGSTLNKFKIDLLKRVRDREIIFVIDKDLPGIKLGENVIRQGWTISYLEGEITDANDALQKMGKLWMLNNIMENRKTNFSAMLALQSIKVNLDKDI